MLLAAATAAAPANSGFAAQASQALDRAHAEVIHVNLVGGLGDDYSAFFA